MIYLKKQKGLDMKNDKILLKQIATMQAFYNGKEIEFGNTAQEEESYINIDAPTWNWVNYHYRVKKKKDEDKKDSPLFVGYMKKQQRNEVTINTTLFDKLDPTKAYFIKVYEAKQKEKTC
jgi:hypothetical protein